MKHTVTPLEGYNDPISFVDLIFKNCFLETDYWSQQDEPSLVPLDTQLELLPCSPVGENESYNIDVHSDSNSSIGSSLVANNIWTLYYDGSKTQDGSRAGCILIDPSNKKHILSCYLEFECTNNIVEYEALTLGLKKAIDMKVDILEVIGDSEVVTCQV